MTQDNTTALLAAQMRQHEDAARRTANLPTFEHGSSGFGPDAFPPGVDREAYVAAMVAKVDGAMRPDTMVSTDFKGRLPVDPRALDDCQGSGGFPRAPQSLKPGDTVAYMGTRVEVEQAVNMGVLERDPAGGYRLPAGAHSQRQDTQASPEEEAAQAERDKALLSTLRAGGDEPDEETSRAIDRVNAIVPGPAIQAVVHDAVTNGSLSLANVTKLAESRGLPTAQATELATTVWSGFRRQADAAAVASGVPNDPATLEALWSWCASADPTEHRMAAINLALASDAAGIKALAKRFLAFRRAHAG